MAAKAALAPATAPVWIMTGALVDAIEGLDSLGSMPMPVPTAAKVCKIINWARPVHKGYMDDRNEIVNRYGTSAGDGKYTVPAEKVNLFNTAMRGIQGAETAPLPSELILTMTDLADIRLTPSQYAKISLFVKE